MSLLLALVLLVVLVLLLAEISARLWRVRHPTTDRFARFRQWRVFGGIWMLLAAVTVAVLAGAHVLPLRR